MKRSVATHAACLFMNKNDSGDEPACARISVSCFTVRGARSLWIKQESGWETKKRKAGSTLEPPAPFQERVGNPSIYLFLIATQIFDVLTCGWPLCSIWWNCDSVLEFLFRSLKGHHLLSWRKEGTSEGPFHKPPTTMRAYVQQCSALAGRLKLYLLCASNAGEPMAAVLSRHIVESKHRV